MAAERLAEAGCAVTIYEKMPTPARRLLMAGIGGLNLTHSEDMSAFLRRYYNADWLKPLIDADAVRRWADDLGAQTFVGSSGRVFPKAMKASPLLRAWLARLDGLGVEIRTRHHWQGWEGEALIFDTPDGRQEARSDATILACGGASWPRLGSDGGWQVPLREAGVEIAPLMPSNCGVETAWSEHMARHAGTPLKNIALRCVGAGEASGISTRLVRGEVIITQTGLEGGAVYALSGAIRAALERGICTLTLDLKPDLDAYSMSERFEASRKRDTLSNRLRKALRLDSASIALIREAGPMPDSAEGVARRIKQHSLTVSGLAGMGRAISTAGGVKADAIDETLMLRARPGVFAAGEMLDWDAPTGGYLLTACFATGRAAAEGALHWLDAQ